MWPCLFKKMQRTNNIGLIRNLISSLILFGKIKTTKSQARAVKEMVDGIITKMKKKSLASRRQVQKILPREKILAKLEKEILPKLGGRTSGYLKTMKTQSRLGDNASQIRLEWAVDTNLSNVTNLPNEVKDAKTDKTK